MTTETQATVDLGEPAPAAEESAPSTSPARRQAGVSSHPALRPLSPAPTYIGIVLVAAGFVLLAVAWGGVAGQSNVALQIPYMVSGGMGGLALIMVGLALVSIATRRRDAAMREQQIQLLAAALKALRESDDSQP
jgi:hypothetical protein